MKYMLLIYSNTAAWDALSEEQRREMARDHATLVEDLMESGEWVGGNPLSDPSSTRTVRVRDGVPATTDGPFAEAKEHLAGHDLVDCESLERAEAIAARIPDARLVAVEVRPVMDGVGMEM